MVYLAIDTDVWLHLATFGFEKEHNPFDELCYWIEQDAVTCIISEHIIAEWDRNKEKKISKIKNTMATSVGQIRSAIQDRAALNKIFNSDNFEAISRARVGLVEGLFNKQVIVTAITDEIKVEAGNRTLQRLAPSHEKDSYSDAVNILSVLKYIRDYALSPAIFVSHNTSDFSAIDDKKLLHPDLLPLFSEVLLAYSSNVDQLFAQLRDQLPKYADHLKRLSAERQTDEQIAAKAEKERLANTDEDYIGNVSMIELVLKQARPTQLQFKTILILIENDANCRKYFFDHVDKPVWLPFMEEQDFLNVARHPGPVDSPQGQYLSHWEPLRFLERLSEKIKEEPDETLIEKLVGHIKAISDGRVDNDLTNTALIRILSNLPNDAISDELLGHLPGWFSPGNNKMFPSTAACDRLLPKFISAHATADEIRKGEEILRFLFGISKAGVEIDNTPEKAETSFYPNANSWVLTQMVIKNDLIDIIAKRCSKLLLLEFARSVKFLVLDYPEGLHFPVTNGEETTTLKITVDLSKLHLEKVGGTEQQSLASATIPDFEALDPEALKAALISAMNDLRVAYRANPENEQRLTGLLYALTVDRLSMAGATAIASMDVDRAQSKNIRSLYTIMLIRYLSAFTEARPEEAIDVCRQLFFEKTYRLPIFRRIVLHNLTVHFGQLRALFQKFLGPDDPNNLFEDFTYRPDLFNLLKNAQHQFNADEVQLVSDIIVAGPKPDEENDEQRINAWRFRWYLALNQTEPFAERYKILSDKTAIRDRDVDPTQTLRFRSGSVSPVSSDALLAKPDNEIMAYILNFEVQDRWEGPSIEGLSNSFKTAVIEQPERFIGMFNQMLVLPYIYTYHLLYAFLDVERKTQDKAKFDWRSLIRFCSSYITQCDFDDSSRTLAADGWHADKHWVMGVIAFLISDLCRLDEVVAEQELLADCEHILLIIKNHGIIAPMKTPQHQDYISHTYNSDNGKFLRACMDYCLCKNRLTDKDHPVFDPAFQQLFDHFLAGQSMDAYTLIGYYWQQFNYLSHPWLIKQLQELSIVDEACWEAFMGGFLFASAPGTDELFRIVLPYYEKAIDQKLAPRVTGTDGFAIHMATLYFWGVVDLSEGSVLYKYITGMPVETLQNLLHVLFFSPGYLKSLDDEEYLKAEIKVIALIEFLHEYFGNSEEPALLELRRSTVSVLHMARALNVQNVAIAGKAIALASKQYHHDDLLERLHELRLAGEPNLTAQHLASLLEQMTFQEHMHLVPDDQKNLGEVIQFLYDFSQKEIANKLCNRLLISGLEFARDLYTRNN